MSSNLASNAVISDTANHTYLKQPAPDHIAAWASGGAVLFTDEILPNGRCMDLSKFCPRSSPVTIDDAYPELKSLGHYESRMMFYYCGLRSPRQSTAISNVRT